MLILILIHVLYLQNVVFSFKKVRMVKNTYWQTLTIQLKKSPLPKFPIPTHWEGGIPTYLFNATWNTPEFFTFPSWGEETFSTYFSVCLWTVTQFSTPKNEMFLKLVLIIRNVFLISTWKYWIWNSKNESILRTTAWKGCWLHFYPKLCAGVSFCFR